MRQLKSYSSHDWNTIPNMTWSTLRHGAKVYWKQFLNCCSELSILRATIIF